MLNYMAESLDNTGWVGGLANLGVAGFMIWWFTQQVMPMLKKIQEALDRFSKVQLMQLLVHPNFPDTAKSAAQDILDQIKGESESK